MIGRQKKVKRKAGIFYPGATAFGLLNCKFFSRKAAFGARISALKNGKIRNIFIYIRRLSN
jgi:hypothetical protein